MKLQVLLSVMNQNDHSILKSANIQTDAIIVNQSDEFKKEEFTYKDSSISFLTFDERGVGLSRNNALMRSTADIAVFGDEDIRYVDGYDEIILSAFKKNPRADMIVFNVPSNNPERPTYNIKKHSRVRIRNCLRYGAVKFAVRTDSIKQKGIYFSLLFGGGAKYSSGEDSLFIYGAIKSGLKVFANPNIIASVSQEASTWFSGYNNQFFIDKGVLFRALSPTFYPVYIIRFIFLNRKSFRQNVTVWHALKLALFQRQRRA